LSEFTKRKPDFREGVLNIFGLLHYNADDFVSI